MASPGWSARQGLITAASVVLAVLMAAALGLEGLWWAAISAWVVSNPDFAALWRKAAMRLVGTAVGLTAGYALAIGLEGVPAFQALALFIICAVGSYQRFASRYGYAWFYGTITLMLMIAVSIVETDALFAFAENRFLEIACGVVASAFAHAVGRPRGSAVPPPQGAASQGRDADLDLVHLALVAGVSVVAMVALWSWFDLPSMPQAIGSSLAVLDKDFASIRVRARQRFLGCVLGAALGLAALLFELDALLVYATVLAAGIFCFSRLHHGGGAQSYIGTQGGLAFITALVTDGGPPAEVLPVLERLAGIFIGVALMVVVSMVLAALHRRPRPVQAPDAA
ncbi:FUSC family protein [Xanthobacter sp. KR7-65]|uniref:FUSC family protein n=1 Tax=Xanthobacter sp. KR7-65 TaxID=3156612 RepID=UPI0032B4AB50